MGDVRIFDAGRWLLFIAALLAAVALVFGMRPRTLAVEIAPARAAAAVLTVQTGCLLCNGAATAATLAPPAHTVLAVGAPLAWPDPAPRVNPVAVDQPGAPAAVVRAPDAPPPRA